MQAFKCIRRDGTLSQVEVPLPRIEAPSQCVVSVRAIGVCYRDVIEARGGYPRRDDPLITGHEFAGVVSEAGEASGWRVGDRVTNLHHSPGGAGAYALAVDGCYASHVRCEGDSLVRLPGSISFVSAAGSGCTAGVALSALRRVPVLPHHHVVVTGASGGVGTAAVQVAAQLGCHVTAVTRDKRRHEALLLRLGAREVVQCSSDSRYRLSSPADVVLELTGGPTFASSLRALTVEGTLVVVGNVEAGLKSGVSHPPLPLGLVIMKRLRIVGSAGCSGAELAHVLELMEAGKIEALVHCTFPLARAQEAQRLVSEAVGRVVLVTEQPHAL